MGRIVMSVIVVLDTLDVPSRQGWWTTTRVKVILWMVTSCRFHYNLYGIIENRMGLDRDNVIMIVVVGVLWWWIILIVRTITGILRVVFNVVVDVRLWCSVQLLTLLQPILDGRL